MASITEVFRPLTEAFAPLEKQFKDYFHKPGGDGYEFSVASYVRLLDSQKGNPMFSTLPVTLAPIEIQEDSRVLGMIAQYRGTEVAKTYSEAIGAQNMMPFSLELTPPQPPVAPIPSVQQQV